MATLDLDPQESFISIYKFEDFHGKQRLLYVFNFDSRFEWLSNPGKVLAKQYYLGTLSMVKHLKSVIIFALRKP